MQIAVFGLLYGDYPHLAQRLLGSWARWRNDPTVTFYVGLNNVGLDTRDEVCRFLSRTRGCSKVDLYEGAPPYYKYPMMRQMFQAELAKEKPAELFMWFDDDSLILPSAPDTFFDDIRARMQDADMLGSIWGQYGSDLYDYIRAQPWFTGRLDPGNPFLSFCTGGWWTIKSEIIKKHNWPPPDFHHNGGDVMLGALCKEQGYRMVDHWMHVGVNCDDTYKNSSARRRGQSLQPIGKDYKGP